MALTVRLRGYRGGGDGASSSSRHRLTDHSGRGRRADVPGRIGPLAASIVGVAALLGCGVLVAGNRTLPPEFGQPAVTVFRAPPAPAAAVHPASVSMSVPAAAPPAASVPRRPGPPPPAPSTAGPVAAAGTGTTPTTPAVAGPGGRPAELRVPSLGVAARVDGMLAQHGVLAPPANPGRVGWWVASSLAGAASGPTVIVGHVDAASSGPGALFRLADVRPGTAVSLVTSTGALVRYTVTALHYYPKDAGLPTSLFAAGGPPRLVLITCGGPFDPDEASYRDNVAVEASPRS